MRTQLDEMKAIFGEATFKGVASFIAVTNFSDKGKALKKSRKNGVPTPSLITNAKKYVYMTVNMGHNYEQLVNGRKKKEGQEKDFVAQKTYTQKITENGMLQEHERTGQAYLRVYRNVSKDLAPRSIIVDGEGNVWETKDFYNTFAEFLPKPSNNSSQGLRGENEIIVHNYKIENVQYVKRGELEYNNLSVDAFRRLFVDYKIQDKQVLSQRAVA